MFCLLQVICDADLMFVDVVAKWPGSVHDSRILRRSALFDAFEGNHRPIDGFLLGDSGYMLREWLLTPVANPQTRQEQNFNFSHSSTRTAVERSIGVAKRRWHCLRRLRISPQRACQIIVVCLMLHNRARLLALPAPDLNDDSDDSDSDDDAESVDEAPPSERARTAAGKVVRNRIMNTYF